MIEKQNMSDILLISSDKKWRVIYQIEVDPSIIMTADASGLSAIPYEEEL